ncbi:hypothetical protein ACHAXS_011841 [Conticribra weissflogii]
MAASRKRASSAPDVDKPTRKRSKTSSTHGNKDEIQQSKSPAEFFAENQSIAGFDNPGKSLYTTLRELIENSLDACESVDVLPDIHVVIEEMSEGQFNRMRGVPDRQPGGAAGEEQGGLKNQSGDGRENDHTAGDAADTDTGTKHSSNATKININTKTNKTNTKSKHGPNHKKDAYFLLTVRDNGCGMAHDAIPDLLGRVLSGSKYGVRQTRGKFGLGAKMALIWSKKSTGVPIRIKTSHVSADARRKYKKSKRGGDSDDEDDEEENDVDDNGDAAVGGRKVGKMISTCVLDIDIYKNSPRVIEHTRKPNTEKWIGTEIQVLVAGNWTTYKSRVVQYLHQLAIITPYARLEMTYSNRSDDKKGMNFKFERRSEQMPPAAREVKHHPSSVSHFRSVCVPYSLRIKLHDSSHFIPRSPFLPRTTAKTLLKFLTNDLSGITPVSARRLIERLGNSFEQNMDPADLDDKLITRLVQLLRSSDDLFKSPDGGCLSPLGEYNLNLGIQKVIEPDIIATARDKPGAYDGHPFIVEAAVSLGGKDAKEGITVVRFANRIPLLFEGGADVATRVANSKIKWSSYKIDHKRDKIGVFVSIVSTKVPFKGTGKEYIGDDIIEIQQSVKRTIQNCCQQLRAHLTKKNALRDVKERKSRLLKYIPDVSRSVFGILDAMHKRKLEEAESGPRYSSPRKRIAGVSSGLDSSKQKHLTPTESEVSRVMERVSNGDLTEDTIKDHLMEAVEENVNAGFGFDENEERFGKSGKSGSKKGGDDDDRQAVYLVPIYDDPQTAGKVIIRHPLFDFHPLNA